MCYYGVMNNKTEVLLIKLGERIKQARVDANITQVQLADIIDMSVRAIKYAEKGKCKLSTFVSILVALKLDDQINLLIAEPPVSPILLEKSKKKRSRASKSITKNNEDSELGW